MNSLHPARSLTAMKLAQAAFYGRMSCADARGNLSVPSLSLLNVNNICDSAFPFMVELLVVRGVIDDARSCRPPDVE